MAKVLSVLLCLLLVCSAEEDESANYTRAWDGNVSYALGATSYALGAVAHYTIRF